MEADDSHMERALGIGGEIVDTETDPRLDVGFIGCGTHAFRNVYPTLQFLPVDLVATCDLDERKARLYAEQFGAKRSYQDYRTMLEDEALDAVLVVLGYDEAGRPRYPPVAIDALRTGCDVWIEKPPAASVEAIERMRRVEDESDGFVQVGFKKCFAPGIEKLVEITRKDEFGSLNTIYVRYPQEFPERDGDARLSHGPDLVGLLDHIVHPGSILSAVGGPFETVTCHPGDHGGGYVTVEFENGCVGTIHMAAGSGQSSPIERVEAVGTDANVVLQNGVDLTYYRPSDRGEYGREPSYLVAEEEAPLKWEPEFSLGQLYNKNLFTLGYHRELAAFVESSRRGTRPAKAGLGMAHQLLQLYKAVLQSDGEPIAIDITTTRKNSQ